MEIKVPFLREEVGLGDVVKKAATVIGRRQCPACLERERRWNRRLSAVPAKPNANRSNAWTKPPEVPVGWSVKASWINPTDPELQVKLFERQGSYMVWEVADGKYRKSYSFCCGLLHRAEEKFAELCL